MLLEFQENYLSIRQFNSIDLPDFCVLTGKNESGKTHLLKGIADGIIKFGDLQKESIRFFDLHSFRVRYQEDINVSKNRFQEYENIYNFFVEIRIAYKESKSKPENQIIQNLDDVIKDASGVNVKVGNTNTSFKNFYNIGTPKDFFNFFKSLPIEEIRRINKYNIMFWENLPIKSSRISNKKMNLSEIFLDYKKILEMAKAPQKYGGNGVSYEEITRLEEKAPWVILTHLLEKFNIPHKFILPEFNIADISSGNLDEYSISLRNGDDEFNIDTLSSGENVLFTLASQAFYGQRNSEFPKLLLLDEIDATLHPSMIKKFIEVINDVFLKHDCKVIMATQSPTTVSLINEDNIYEVKKEVTHQKITKIKKEKAVSILGEGFIRLEEGLNILNDIAKNQLTMISEGKNYEHIERAIQVLDKDLSDKIGFFDEIKHKCGVTEVKRLFEFFQLIKPENPILCIVDCDASISSCKAKNNTYFFRFDENKNNSLAKKGIENLYSEEFLEEFAEEKEGHSYFHDNKKNDLIQKILKTESPKDFENFKPLINEIKRILNLLPS